MNLDLSAAPILVGTVILVLGIGGMVRRAESE